MPGLDILAGVLLGAAIVLYTLKTLQPTDDEHQSDLDLVSQHELDNWYVDEDGEVPDEIPPDADHSPYRVIGFRPTRKRRHGKTQRTSL